MPRILKVDLVRLNESLSAELDMVLAENVRLRVSLTKMWNERDELETVHKERDRSRSPRRNTEASAATTRLALDAMCRHERDEVVHEQRETIARLQAHIAALTLGEGLMWPILVARWDALGLTTDFIRERITSKGTTVANFVGRLVRLNAQQSDLLNWGTSSYDSDTSGVAFQAARSQRDA